MPEEANSERGLELSTNGGGSKGFTNAVRGALLHHIPMWGLLILAGLGLLGGLSVGWYAGNSDLATKRWKARGQVIASDSYVKGVTPHPIPEHPGKLSEDWTKPHVAVYSVASTRSPRLHPTLRDLAERGQARAIDFMAHDSVPKPHAWPELLNALNDGGEPGPGEIDPFKFDRVLVATVTKGVNWDPGDRMVWTRVFIEPINFRFAGYTVADTDNATVKVTSIEATKTRKFSADLGLTVPGLEEGPKASLAPTSERTIKETSDITAQYEKLGIDILPGFLRIIRESVTGGDVVGNTKVSLSIMTDISTIYKATLDEKYLTSKRKNDLVLLVRSTKLDEVSDGDKKKPSIDVLPQAPVPHCPLRAMVWMLYEQRHIEGGRKYYDEARQTISFVRDKDAEQYVDIVSADDVSPAVWTLKICAGQCDPNGNDPNLQAYVLADGQKRDLVLTDYGEAVKLAHWLRY